jgi:hypothetical protein
MFSSLAMLCSERLAIAGRKTEHTSTLAASRNNHLEDEKCVNKENPGPALSAAKKPFYTQLPPVEPAIDIRGIST